MDEGKINMISSQIDKLYADCISSAVAEAMTAEFGDAAFSEFVRLDTEQTASVSAANQQAGKNPIAPITQNKQRFSDFDVQACSKTLLYMTEIRDRVFAYYSIDNTNDEVMQKLRQPLRRLIKGRNQKKHTEGQLDQQLLKDCAKDAITVVETLFPRRADISHPQKFSYLRQMEQAYASFLNENTAERYAVADYIDPKAFDLSRFYEVCIRLKIRPEMEEGVSYFYSFDLDRDLALLKNNLPRRAASGTASAQTWAAAPQPSVQQPAAQVQQPVQQPVSPQPGRYAPAQQRSPQPQAGTWTSETPRQAAAQPIRQPQVQPVHRSASGPQYGTPHAAPAQQYGTPHAAPAQQYGTQYAAPAQQYGTPHAAPAQQTAKPKKSPAIILIAVLGGVSVLLIIALVVLLVSPVNPGTAKPAEDPALASPSGNEAATEAPSTEAPTEPPTTEAPTEPPTSETATEPLETAAPTESPIEATAETSESGETSIGSLGIDSSHVSNPEIFEYEDDIRALMAMHKGTERRLHEIPNSAFDELFRVGETWSLPKTGGDPNVFSNEYYSYDTTIATVSNNGIITALKPGITYLVVLYKMNGRLTNVYVYEVSVSE